jgi:hypothetical protein
MAAGKNWHILTPLVGNHNPPTYYYNRCHIFRRSSAFMHC